MSRKLLLLLWLWLAAGIAAITAMVLLQPEGHLKWALWAVAVVPMGLFAIAAVEGVAHLFMSLPGMKQGTSYFERRAEGKEFSVARVAWYGFAAILGFTVVVTGAAAVRSGYSLVRDFVSQDKCLDGGGQWKAEERECQYSRGHAR
jgi:hypothetical protein